MPWKNSWFQAALCAAFISGGLLVMNYVAQPHPGQTSDSNQAPQPDQTPANPPQTPADNTPPTPNPTPPSQPAYSNTPTPPPYGVPAAGKEWTNSYGVVFRVIPGANILVADIDTRVSDFAAFVNESGYDATGGMNVITPGTIDFWATPADASWKNPGFTQTDDCPVTGVNWNDANAYCDWLTKLEQRMGWLTPNQKYRLPTNAEWDLAVGSVLYPWGNDWPPPKGAGNYAGGELGPPRFIPGYNDGYPRTSPVGTFTSDANLLLDMGGNVWQWTADGGDDQSKILRGGSWDVSLPTNLVSAYKQSLPTTVRKNDVGFRVVIDLGQ